MARTSGRAATLIASGLLLLLVGCGSSPAATDGGVASLQSEAPSGASATPAASVDPEQALLDYADCMRDQGIDMPDPQFGENGGFIIGADPSAGGQGEGPDFASDEFRAADESCSKHMEGIGPRGDPEQEAEILQNMLEFAQCMREHGIDFPDPEPGQGAVLIGGPGEEMPFDPKSDEFQAAERECVDLLDLGEPVGPGTEGGQP